MGPAYPPTTETAETELLRRLLPPDAPRALVEVGAHDGVATSSSLPLVADGWSAILVEPHPEVFERLLFVHGANPDAFCVRGACSDRPGRMPLHLGSGENSMLSSLTDRRGDPVLSSTQAGAVVEVDVYLLADVLAARSWPSDYAVLLVDTEGHDLEVLRGAGLDRWRPRIVVTEDYPFDLDGLRAKHELLWSSGYGLFDRIGANSVWIDASRWSQAVHSSPGTWWS